MKRMTAYIAAAIALAACSPRIVQVPVRDTLTVTRTEILRDTVVSFVLPEETSRNETRDTSSRIETSLAVSEASVSGGVLRHTLTNKPDTLQKNIACKERVVTEYRTKEVPVPVEIPKPYTPKWVWWVLAYSIILTVAEGVKAYLKVKI